MEILPLMMVTNATSVPSHRPFVQWFSGMFCACAMMLFTSTIAFAQEEADDSDISPGEMETPSPGEFPPEPGAPPELPDLDGPEQVRLPVSDPPWNSWFVEIEDDAPLRGQEENFGEHNAYNFTLAYASLMDPELMAKHGENVRLIELIQPIRREYFNRLIHFEGRVRRLSKFSATRHLRETEDIQTIYEAWIVPKDEGKPVCFLFTELPEGMEPNPGGKVDYYVAFEGYYFKLMHYESSEMKKDGSRVVKRAPLLVGRTVRLIPAPVRPESLFLTPSFAVLLFTVFGSVILTGLGFLWWFRRADRRVQEKLAQKRGDSNPFQESSTLAVDPDSSGDDYGQLPGSPSGPIPPRPYLN